MTKLHWTPVRLKLSDIKTWINNPRHSTKAQAKKILDSMDEFGQVETIAVDAENNLVNGHQRYFALMTVKPPHYELDARRADRVLTEQEKRKLTILLHTGATGSWNWETLSGWDTAEMQGWGMDTDALKDWNNDALNLRIMLIQPIDEASAFENLPDSDRAPFQQMTFTLHDTQVEQVREAIKLAKAHGAFADSENANSNGNALARICEIYITEHGNR